ncbi:hypothetical protein MPH_02378 [Macrophomina phaseolina MS6]|uniref:Uncharacterized protein n=1 Tax=Macrophomina phaseolina (strain MS6) TaxID=1126212 RepID=K2RCJ7_MACPH|nr:hypothetical protein MPH_02378 [Macrophomina phaseolina MS6]
MRSDTIEWDGAFDSIEDATNEPITARRTGPGLPFRQTLDQLTHFRGSTDDGSYYRNAALGAIWKSLGHMILGAVGRPPQDKDTIMGHVLELLALLHHAGIIPESVYRYEAPNDAYSLQKPPTLYLLSSRILTALSDAAWRAQEKAATASHKSEAQYNFLGQEIPGSRYKVRTPELGSEVWLELVLWSCLHGGWAIDGIEILKKLASYSGHSRWSVIHWRNILQDQAGFSFRNMTWTDLWSFARARGTQANSPDRFIVQKTVSSEVVAAYVDRLLSRVGMGVGSRGDPALQIFKDVLTLKDLLNRDNLGLGTATWESVMVRFLESGGIDMNTEGRWLERLLRLSTRYGREHDYMNAPHELEDSRGSPSYILDPSAVSLGVSHQALRVHVTNGNIGAAARVISRLQAMTDENKKLSIQKFFEKLNSGSGGALDKRGSFSSNTPSHTYPTYFPQIPPPLLAGVLKLATQAQAFDFARQLLYSDDFDGPLIPQDLYSHGTLAAAITEFAIAANDGQLLHTVITLRSKHGSITPEMTRALLENQMHHDKWETVENIVRSLVTGSDKGWVANVSAVLAKRLLVLQDRAARQPSQLVDEKHPLALAASLFRRSLRAQFGEGHRERYNRFHGILCVLASVGPEWRDFCSGLFVYRGPRSLEKSVSEDDFMQILQGVVEGRGPHEGMQLMVMWCKDVRHAPPLEQAHQVEEKRPDPAVSAVVEEVVVDMPKGTTNDVPDLVLRGQRLSPKLPMMRTVYQAALQQYDLKSVAAWREGKMEEILRWAVMGLRAMGLGKKEIAFELQGIASVRDVWRKSAAARRRVRRVYNRLSRKEEKDVQRGRGRGAWEAMKKQRTAATGAENGSR